METTIARIIKWNCGIFRVKMEAEFTVTGTQEDIFEVMYGARKESENDSEMWYEFRDKSLKKAYKKWRRKRC